MVISSFAPEDMVRCSRISPESPQPGLPWSFIKNIDNIAPETRHDELGRWKRQLTGHLHQTAPPNVRVPASVSRSNRQTQRILSEILEFLIEEFALELRLNRARVDVGRPRVQALETGSTGRFGSAAWSSTAASQGADRSGFDRQDGSIDGQIVEACPDRPRGP